MDDIWENDLADLSSLSKYNEKYKYLLNAIDIFLRYAWSAPLKDNTGTYITTALKILFRDRTPSNTQSHKGDEFVNAIIQHYIKRQGVNFHKTQIPNIKAVIIELLAEL